MDHDLARTADWSRIHRHHRLAAFERSTRGRARSRAYRAARSTGETRLTSGTANLQHAAEVRDLRSRRGQTKGHVGACLHLRTTLGWYDESFYRSFRTNRLVRSPGRTGSERRAFRA